MQLEILNQTSGNRRLILIVAGWSTDAALYKSISRKGWDVALIHDYSSLSFPRREIRELCESYPTVYLYAWSMGVFAACYAGLLSLATETFAINGTPTPVSDETGIPERIYDGTHDGLNERTLRKFHRRMFGSAEEFAEWNSLLPGNPDIESLKAQLAEIKRASAGNVRAGKWSKAFISEHDAIFPCKAQLDYWRKTVVSAELLKDCTHFVDLNKIISRTIVDLEKVKAKFQDSSSTYDANAVAQWEAIRMLMEMIASEKSLKGGSVLEIGFGTGLFTREYADVLLPDELNLVDLYQGPKLDFAPVENYIVTDAEVMLETLEPEKSYNHILSTNTIQWFTNLPRFFNNCSRHLKPGGLLAFSTFGPRNLYELNHLRTSSIRYYSGSEIMEMLKTDFNGISFKARSVKVRFPSIRSLLMHLKLTGVGGGMESQTDAGSREAGNRYLSKIKAQPDGSYILTYDIICVVARKG